MLVNSQVEIKAAFRQTTVVKTSFLTSVLTVKPFNNTSLIAKGSDVSCFQVHSFQLQRHQLAAPEPRPTPSITGSRPMCIYPLQPYSLNHIPALFPKADRVEYREPFP